MSIFGDETITIDESPEQGQEELMAEETENEESYSEEQDDQDYAEDAQEDDEEQSDDEEDSSPEEGQDDSLILGKFKNANDLAKAYANLEREFTKSRQQNSNIQPAAQQQQGGQQQSQQDQNDLFWERFRADPFATIQSLVNFSADQRLAPLQEERRSETMTRNLEAISKEYKQLGSDNGIQQLVSKLGEIASELGNPELIQNPTPRALKMAAQELWGDTKTQAFQRGKEAARTEGERTRQSKQGLSAKGGAKQQQQKPTVQDEIADAILAAGKGGGGIFG